MLISSLVEVIWPNIWYSQVDKNSPSHAQTTIYSFVSRYWIASVSDHDEHHSCELSFCVSVGVWIHVFFFRFYSVACGVCSAYKGCVEYSLSAVLVRGFAHSVIHSLGPVLLKVSWSAKQIALAIYHMVALDWQWVEKEGEEVTLLLPNDTPPLFFVLFWDRISRYNNLSCPHSVVHTGL